MLPNKELKAGIQQVSSDDSRESSVSFFHQKAARLLLKVRPEFLASFLKRILQLKRKNVLTPDGIFYVDIASSLGQQLFKRGIYESGMVQVLKTYLQPGSIYVDLGANEGYFSVIASQRVGINGKVIAVEPQSRLQPILSKNLSLNDSKNVTVLQIAISDKSEPLTLFISTDMNTGSTSAVETSRFSQPKQEVTGLTLTELFRQQEITTCDLLKLDIEGYEYEAIMGSPEIFKSHRVKAIALELHPQHLAKRGLSEQTIVDFLKSCGYTLNTLGSNIVFTSPKG